MSKRPGRIAGTSTAPLTGKRECPRCTQARERAEQIAQGHGTPAEIRAALNLLERVPKLGLTVRVRADSGGFVDICPWCSGLCTDEVPTTNRALRRRLKARVDA